MRWNEKLASHSREGKASVVAVGYQKNSRQRMMGVKGLMEDKSELEAGC